MRFKLWLQCQKISSYLWPKFFWKPSLRVFLLLRFAKKQKIVGGRLWDHLKREVSSNKCGHAEICIPTVFKFFLLGMKRHKRVLDLKQMQTHVGDTRWNVTVLINLSGIIFQHSSCVNHKVRWVTVSAGTISGEIITALNQIASRRLMVSELRGIPLWRTSCLWLYVSHRNFRTSFHIFFTLIVFIS